MPEVEIFMRGDQIAIFDGLIATGSGYDSQITSTGVTPIGPASQLYRIAISDIGPGNFHFAAGQHIDIYAWPDGETPIYSGLAPHHDSFDGRASSSGHQIIGDPAQILFQVEPIIAGTVHYAPGPLPDLGLFR